MSTPALTTSASTRPLPDRYVVISADCHGGASVAAYKDYLEPKYHDDFDAWRGAYRNPFRDLQDDGRARNWDDARRISDLEADGQVGEVVFPNTVPPFFPTGALVARPPNASDLEHRWAGLRAHNRWLAEWCAGQPARRAGIGQVFLNDVDAAIAEVRWISEHGLRGGVLIPTVPDDVDFPPLYARAYDPLWRLCQETGTVVNVHSGSGHPDYGQEPGAGFMWLIETGWFSHRAFWQMVMGGVFERFPALKLVLTEQGCAWLPPLLYQLDSFHAQAASGRIHEVKMAADERLQLKPSEYFERNVWVGVSFPSPVEAQAMKKLGTHKVMWGSDYPHIEGCSPFSRESMRRSFHDWSPDDLHAVLCTTVADVYDFDIAALAPIAAAVGPTVAEIAVPLDAIPAGATSPAFYMP